jgi:cell division protein FtsZ
LSVTLISSLPADEVEVAPRKSKAHAAPPPPPEAVVEAAAEPQIVQFVQPEATESEPVMEAEVYQRDEIVAPEPVAEDILPPPEVVVESEFTEPEIDPESEHAPRPTTPRIIPPKKKPLVAPKVETENAKREKAAAAKQEILQFEPLTRGRFEKSEPTIVEGQDLDVPTFLRKNVRVK